MSSSPPAPRPTPDAGSAAAIPGLASRELALHVLQAVAAGAHADGALERELVRSNLQPSDRGLATELAYGAIRQRRLLDAWLDALGRVPADRQPPRLRWLLHLGCYQLLFCDRIPAAAAVSTSVELAKRAGLGRLAPVVNGVLRQLLRRRQPLGPAAPAWQGLPQLDANPSAAMRLGLQHSLPDWLADLLLEWRSPQQAEAFAASCNQPPTMDLRINTLRANRDVVLDTIRAAGVSAQPLSEPQGLTLTGRVGDLRHLPGFAEGHWCVQDRSAQRISPLLDPQPGMRILDACAAPGGKSTHLAELIGDDGEIWALDRSEARLGRLRRNAERLGLSSIRTVVGDGAHLARDRPEWLASFDRILLDAPCSGLGTLARHADARWRIAPPALQELTCLQDQLLEGVLPLLRPGGLLVYSTCTVHPAENGERIAALLERHSTLQMRDCRQWWPGEQPGDGFFVAVISTPEPVVVQGSGGSGGGSASGGAGAGAGADAAAGAGAGTGAEGVGAEAG